MSKSAGNRHAGVPAVYGRSVTAISRRKVRQGAASKGRERAGKRNAREHAINSSVFSDRPRQTRLQPLRAPPSVNDEGAPIAAVALGVSRNVSRKPGDLGGASRRVAEAGFRFLRRPRWSSFGWRRCTAHPCRGCQCGPITQGVQGRVPKSAPQFSENSGLPRRPRRGRSPSAGRRTGGRATSVRRSCLRRVTRAARFSHDPAGGHRSLCSRAAARPPNRRLGPRKQPRY